VNMPGDFCMCVSFNYIYSVLAVYIYDACERKDNTTHRHIL
jgi:hypothetical protein